MENFSNMRTISSLKTQIKIFAFYFVDILVIASALYVGKYAQDLVFHFPFVQFVLFQSLNVIFSIWLCWRSPDNPTRKNAMVLVLYLKKDYRRFMSLDYQFIKRKK